MTTLAISLSPLFVFPFGLSTANHEGEEDLIHALIVMGEEPIPMAVISPPVARNGDGDTAPMVEVVEEEEMEEEVEMEEKKYVPEVEEATSALRRWRRVAAARPPTKRAKHEQTTVGM